MAQARFPSKLQLAREWLREHMVDGEAYAAGELQARAIEDGIKRRTLQLAATYEAEVKPKHGAQGIETWEWRLK